jgi:hypothetical protein
MQKNLCQRWQWPFKVYLKDSIQQNLRWVKSSANHWVLASGHGTGQCFTFLIRSHLLFAVFLFPFTTAE